MLRGISRVCTHSEMVSGNFYLRHSYDNKIDIFQYIQIEEEGQKNYTGLVFDPGEKYELYINDLNGPGPFVELLPTSVRVDGASFCGTSFTTSMRPGRIYISGQDIFVTAQTSNYNWITVNINSGKVARLANDRNWATFSRWELTIDADGEEVPIANFDQPLES